MLCEKIKLFKGKNIAVIGDVMLDKYLFGNVDRISPEAPVPVVQVKDEKFVAGGAANAANNIVTLGGNAFLFGVTGEDPARDILLNILDKNKINSEGIVSEKRRPTIQKVRVIGHKQQLLRIDYEDNGYTGSHTKIIGLFRSLKSINGVIISDYAKGTITPQIASEVIAYCSANKIPLIVDPKPKHKFFYKGATLITPNRKEAEELAGMPINTENDAESAGKKLVNELGCNVLITLGERGMMLVRKDKPSLYIPAKAKEVYDVSGAGDTVVAALALALSSRISLQEASLIANCAGGIKVSKFGTAPVDAEELMEELKNEVCFSR